MGVEKQLEELVKDVVKLMDMVEDLNHRVAELAAYLLPDPHPPDDEIFLGNVYPRRPGFPEDEDGVPAVVLRRRPGRSGRRPDSSEDVK
jgi:hypothetical protein